MQTRNDARLAVGAPVPGRVVLLTDVNDPAFSSGALGLGAAVMPDDGTITAPVSGQLLVAMPHAYGIQTDFGTQVLVHVGIGTVNTAGQHFAMAVSPGERVSFGDTLCKIDLAALSSAAIDSTVIVVVPNAEEDQEVRPTSAALVGRGETLLSVRGEPTDPPV